MLVRLSIEKQKKVRPLMVAISLDLNVNFVYLGLENCAFIVELELGVIKAYGEWSDLIANLELESTQSTRAWV